MEKFGQTPERPERALINIQDIRLGWRDIFSILLLTFVFILLFLADNSGGMLNLLIIPLVLVGYSRNIGLPAVLQKLVLNMVLAGILTYGLRMGLEVYQNVLAPPRWDFHLYWVYGQAGSRFLNPYESENLLPFVQTLNPTQEFMAEFYFFQAPPLIFLFLPLGWFDIHTASFVWYIFLLAVLLLDIVLLWSIYYDRANYKSLILVTLLVLAFRGTILTLSHAQLNFLVLLAFLSYWRRRGSVAGGIWLGAGMIIKPILILTLIYPVLRRHWRSLLGVAAAVLLLSATTIAVFGPGMFFGYFSDNPVMQKMPDYSYTEEANQSLLATILRLTKFDFSDSSPYIQPVFIAAALLITGVTAFLLFSQKDEARTHSHLALALTITFALLIFPKTLTHYSVLLISPILTIWTNRKAIGLNFWLILAFITAEFLLVNLEGNFIFAACLIAWLFAAGICSKLLFHNPNSG